ncbi:MAG: hypothetical protein ABR529_07490 [Actinomycetota bacterium]
MKRLRSLLLVVTLALGAVPLVAAPAWACSCAGGTRIELARAADAIFTGSVTEISHARGVLEASFEVDTSYKGDVAGSALVGTADQGSACGVPFEHGRTYTVFAYNNGGWQTHSCAGTKPGAIDAARYELTGTRVAAGAAERDRTAAPSKAADDAFDVRWVGAAVALALAGALWVALGRRRGPVA